MQKVLSLVLTLSSSVVFGADVLYCGGLGIEGSYLKINPDQNRMCISYGQWGHDYCANASISFDIVETRTGTLNINGNEFSFREFVGNSNSGTQLVRVFDDASNPSGAGVVIHRADLAGPYLLLGRGAPNAEALDGEATCMEGDDNSF